MLGKKSSMYEYSNPDAAALREQLNRWREVRQLFDRVDLPRRYNRTYGGKTRVAHVNKRAVSASVREIIKRVRRQTPDKVTGDREVIANAKRSATQAVNNFRARISDTYTPITRVDPADIDIDALLVETWRTVVIAHIREKQTVAQAEAFDAVADWNEIEAIIYDHTPRKVTVAFLRDADRLSYDIISNTWDDYERAKEAANDPGVSVDDLKAMLTSLQKD